MNDETGTVKIKSETVSEDSAFRKHSNWGKTGKLIIEDEAGKDIEYELNPIRTFELKTETLEVGAVGSYIDEESKSPLIKTHHVLRGTALLHGTLGVIGAPKLKTRILNLSLKGSQDGREQPWKERGEVMPTAFVGFNRADWEVGSDDDWFAECFVAEAVLTEIIESVRTGRIKSLKINLRLQNIYTDDRWSPPSVRTDWFLRPNRSDNGLKIPELAQGVVSGVFLSERAVTLTEPAEEKTESDEESLEQEQPQVLNESDPKTNPVAESIVMLTAQLVELRRVVWWILMAIVAAAVVLKIK